MVNNCDNETLVRTFGIMYADTEEMNGFSLAKIQFKNR